MVLRLKGVSNDHRSMLHLCFGKYSSAAVMRKEIRTPKEPQQLWSVTFGTRDNVMLSVASVSCLFL